MSLMPITEQAWLEQIARDPAAIAKMLTLIEAHGGISNDARQIWVGRAAVATVPPAAGTAPLHVCNYFPTPAGTLVCACGKSKRAL